MKVIVIFIITGFYGTIPKNLKKSLGNWKSVEKLSTVLQKTVLLKLTRIMR